MSIRADETYEAQPTPTWVKVADGPVTVTVKGSTRAGSFAYNDHADDDGSLVVNATEGVRKPLRQDEAKEFWIKVITGSFTVVKDIQG